MRTGPWRPSVARRGSTDGHAATERQRRLWDTQARSYDGQMGLLDGLLFGDDRAWVCSRAEGDVLEVAVGTGRNLPFYPGEVRLTGIELSPKMLAIARRRARELGLDVDLQQGDAQALPFPGAVFDTVVCTHALCCIPDERRRSPGCSASSGRGDGCSCWITSRRPLGCYATSSGCSNR